MKEETFWWGRTMCVVMVLAFTTVAAEGTNWPRDVNLTLTVVDPNGKPVPQFEAMLHSNQHGYTRWQMGRDGVIHFGAGDIHSLSVQEDPHFQVVVRAPDLAPAILHREYGLSPIKETVSLAPGRLIELFVRTADDRSLPEDVTPLVIYSDFASRVRIFRMPENRRPDYVPDFEMSKVTRIAERRYQFRVPAKAPPFLVAIHQPGFMRSVESDYFTEEDLADGRIEWEIPASAKLHVQFDGARAGDLASYESGWIDLACEIPEEGKYITVWRQENKGSAVDALLTDLPSNRYWLSLYMVPPEEKSATDAQPGLHPYHDRIQFKLAAGEEKTLKLACIPFDPGAWRGNATAVVTMREYGGKPAAGNRYSVSYVDPHYGGIPVQEGVLDNEGRLRLENIASGPEGPVFFLQVGEEWSRRMRIGGPESQDLELTLAPQVGDIVPDVAFFDVHEDKDVSLRSLRGHVVYLEFWATWCGPCKVPMTQLNEMMRKHPRYWDGHVDVLAVSIDDEPGVVPRYVKHRGWGHIRHVWTGSRGQTGFESPATQAFGINGVPTAVLIAPDGRIVWKGHPKDANCPTQIDELYRSTDTKTGTDSAG